MLIKASVPTAWCVSRAEETYAYFVEIIWIVSAALKGLDKRGGGGSSLIKDFKKIFHHKQNKIHAFSALHERMKKRGS